VTNLDFRWFNPLGTFTAPSSVGTCSFRPGGDIELRGDPGELGGAAGH
jgi:hypothetical protein